MDMQAFEDRAAKAEGLLEVLRARVQSLRGLREKEEIAKLNTENDRLRKEIDTAKQELSDAETKNGKVQVALPGQPGYKAPTPKAVSDEPSKAVEVSPAKAAPAKAAEGSGGTDAPKKEKGKKWVKEKKGKAPAAAASSTELPHIGHLDLRVALMKTAKQHPDADSLFLEDVDCGEENSRQVISGLGGKIPMEELQNRLVIVLINLPKSKLRGLESFAMVMCASSEDGTTEMIDPPAGSKPGDVITVEGYDRTPDVEKQISKKKYKKVWEAVQADFTTDDGAVACYKGAQWKVNGEVCKAKGLAKAIIK